MAGIIWNTLLVKPLLNALVAFYSVTGNLGLSIILLTAAIRAALIPVVAPSMKSMQKQRDLQPELEKIKSKYKYDKKMLAEKQMELFKKHNINPASGCLSQVVMILVLIALFTVIRHITLNGDISAINKDIYFPSLTLSSNQKIETKFLYLDLAKPDPYFILAILSGVLQFIASKMTIPAVERAEKNAKKTETKTDDMAYMMQQQTLYFLPIMNVIIGVTLPSGVVLYILTTTIFMIIQNYFTSGWGGLKPFINKLKSAKLG